MKQIEVEVRSFISEKEYNSLLEFFKKSAELIKEDYQETFYFDCTQDLRIQRNNSFAKIWLKKGKIHDKHREEIEVKVNREDFENLEELFKALNMDVEIKWYRKRFEFKWEDTKVCLDHTRGYGYIIELEKIVREEKKEEVYNELKEKLESLDVDITPKEEFEKAFDYYKRNWKKLT